MSEEGKKISFGFSKFTKKTKIVPSTLNQVKTDNKSVELIDCFEGKTIKLKNPVQSVEKILVIPLQKQKNSNHDFVTEDVSKSLTSATGKSIVDSNSRDEPETKLNENVIINEKDSESTANLNNSTTKSLTLDEIAAKEILEDLNDKKKEDEGRIFTVPLTNNPPAGEKESSLEDYENIPVGDFGLAMLRGMGWAPGKGIGKNEKLVTPSLPTLRPKGMGLGADKVLKSSVDTKVSNEDLKMVKNGFIRVIAGQHKDLYGQIEGFDDETGRLIVKLALKNISVSLNEFMVQLVDRPEFLKNSKVINVSKYEQYKDDESKKKPEVIDVNLQRKSFDKQSPVDEYDKQNKEKQQRSNIGTSSSKSTNLRKLYIDSPGKEPKERKTDRKIFLEHSRKSLKHSNKRHSRSRSSSTSSSDMKSQELTRRSFKRSRSTSGSSSSRDSYRKSRKSSKNKYKQEDSDHRSSSRAKSHRNKKSRSSSDSSSSSVTSDYYKKSVYMTEKNLSSSKRYKSKRRSKSPKERHSSKKHGHKKR